MPGRETPAPPKTHLAVAAIGTGDYCAQQRLIGQPRFTPFSTADSQHISEELLQLQAAFASLGETNSDPVQTPVAVLLTKWDRCSDLDPDRPEAELAKAKSFLADHPAHRALVDSIANALVGPPPPDEVGPGLPWRNCRVFPVTAFGQTPDRSGDAPPPPGQQQPVGVLEPLLWLADRCDELDAARLEGRQKELSARTWRPELRSRWRLHRDAERRLRRASRDSPAWKKMDAVNSSALRSFVTALIASGAALVVVAAVFLGAWQNLRFSMNKAVVKDPQSDDATLLASRQWFEDFQLGPWVPWLSPTKPEASRLVREIDTVRDQRLWEPVAAAEDDAAKAAVAKKYLDALPNGKHSGEASEIIERHTASSARTENEQWLNRQRREFERLSASCLFKDFRSELGRGWPKPEFKTPEQTEALAALQNDVSNRVAVCAAEESWGRYLTDYRELLSKGESVTATKVLGERTRDRTLEWEQLVREHSLEVKRIVSRHVDQLLKDRRYDDARATVETDVKALKDLETDLRSLAPDLATLLEESQRDLTQQARRVDEDQDRDLYEQVLVKRGKTQVDRYLEGGRPKHMSDSITKYRRYLGALEQELEVDVSLAIQWASSYGSGGEHDIVVEIDGVPVFRTSNVAAPADPLSGPATVGRFKIAKRRRSTPFTLKMRIVESDLIWDDEAGEGHATLTIDELRKGMFRLRLKVKDADPHEAQLKITAGVPAEPELPAWKAQ